MENVTLLSDCGVDCVVERFCDGDVDPDSDRN